MLAKAATSLLTCATRQDSAPASRTIQPFGICPMKRPKRASCASSRSWPEYHLRRWYFARPRPYRSMLRSQRVSRSWRYHDQSTTQPMFLRVQCLPSRCHSSQQPGSPGNNLSPPDTHMRFQSSVDPSHSITRYQKNVSRLDAENSRVSPPTVQSR